MIKTKVPKPKYIAEGFCEDAMDLLNEFTQRGTTEFPKFADIWKKHHFSLIFMGRPDHVENTEFTNEIFKISAGFLSSASFYEKIGAVYILYALFRNQISVPSVKIRLEINQWRVIKTLHIEAKLKNYNTLHYVIDYLIKHAFIYVAHQMLKGPLTGSQNDSKNSDALISMRSNYKSDIMEYSISNNLQKLRDLHTEYLEAKKNCSGVKISLNSSSDSYEQFIQKLNSLVDPPAPATSKETVGSRRAKIKAQSFTRKTQNRFGNNKEQSDKEVDSIENLSTPKKQTVKKKSVKTKRVPERYRRVGRRKKNAVIEPEITEESQSDNEIDISHLLSQQQELYLPPEQTEQKKIRTRKNPYYKVSPKREELSDPDDPTEDL